jgi:dipeptidyl aminopeptidase/acylaminoacyl peptidase
MVFDLASRPRVCLRATGSGKPNWSRDGRRCSSTRRQALHAAGRRLGRRAAHPSYRCNNDHDWSADGTRLAFSASSPTSPQSQVYVADADGRNPRLVVPAPLSYFHGWSPDGKYLSFVGRRDGTQFDLYRIAVEGGVEERLTMHPAHDDGTDYSRDGAWIYFNSERGGGNDIWRMPADGAGPNDVRAERITSDDQRRSTRHPRGGWCRVVPAGNEGPQRPHAAGAAAPAYFPAASRRPPCLRCSPFTGGQGDQRQLVVV